MDKHDEVADPDGLFATYGGSALTHAQAAALGAGAVAGLGSTAADKTYVSITLCHGFGMGSGVGGALLSGGAVVLPAADGICGCGDPSQRAEVTPGVVQTRRPGCGIAGHPRSEPPSRPRPPARLAAPEQRYGRVGPALQPESPPRHSPLHKRVDRGCACASR